MKILSISLFVTFAALLISMRIGSINQFKAIESIESDQTALALYGKNVFENEGCINCHTLRIENDSLNKISLDGYRGKRSTIFLYMLLNQPRDVIYAAEMPSFSYLDDHRLSKSKLPSLFGTNNEEQLDSIWNTIITESDAFASEINKYQAKIYKDSTFKEHNTEMIALIAFLKQIPPSKEQMRQDSIANAAYLLELAEWEKLFEKSDSLIPQLASDQSIIEKGRLLFNHNCTPCHGGNGQGDIAPNLTDRYWIHGNTYKDIMSTIILGTHKGMPRHMDKLTYDQLSQIVVYINSIRDSNQENAKAPQGTKY